ncbi:MAG: DNA gyrase inhibitor YacG [Sphingomonas sp.]
MTKRDTCPVCDKATDPAHKPFCSRGCKDRDLLQWLGEGYRIPAGPADADEESGLDTAGDRD